MKQPCGGWNEARCVYSAVGVSMVIWLNIFKISGTCEDEWYMYYYALPLLTVLTVLTVLIVLLISSPDPTPILFCTVMWNYFIRLYSCTTILHTSQISQLLSRFW